MVAGFFDSGMSENDQFHETWDTPFSIADITGSSFNDGLTGNALNNGLTGNGGADSLTATAVPDAQARAAQQSIDNLHTIADLCRAGRPLPIFLASWLAASLNDYLLGNCASLNEAFGLKKSRGGIPWRTAERIRTRNAALRALAKRHFGQLPAAAQARRIKCAAAHYGATAWRFDRDRELIPTSYVGTPREFLWRAFKSGAAMPLCARQLRDILKTDIRSLPAGLELEWDNARGPNSGANPSCDSSSVRSAKSRGRWHCNRV